jgi:hypothetical protein
MIETRYSLQFNQGILLQNLVDILAKKMHPSKTLDDEWGLYKTYSND